MRVDGRSSENQNAPSAEVRDGNLRKGNGFCPGILGGLFHLALDMARQVRGVRDGTLQGVPWRLH